MEMSPEKRAFIQSGMKPQVPVKAAEVAEAPREEKTVELQVPVSAQAAAQDSRAKSARRQSKGRGTQQGQPDASDILDQVLVPVTIRLPHRMAQALKRAYLEQRLKHAKPDTQQEIVEEALGEWLSQQGFLE
jgi:hypothetical protein